MSRLRSVSTEISTDERLGPLGEAFPMAVLLYTLAIPHADDWGRLKGDPTAFKLAVAPFLLLPTTEIDALLDKVAEAGLWRRYEVNGRKFIAFPRESWFSYQSYIPLEKRIHDGSKLPAPPGEQWESWESRPSAQKTKKQQKTAQNSEDEQGAANNSASPSPSPTPSLSDDDNKVARELSEEGQSSSLSERDEFEDDDLPILPDSVKRLLEGCPEHWEYSLRCELSVAGGHVTNPERYCGRVIRNWKKGDGTPLPPEKIARAPVDPNAGHGTHGSTAYQVVRRGDLEGPPAKKIENFTPGWMEAGPVKEAA